MTVSIILQPIGRMKRNQVDVEEQEADDDSRLSSDNAQIW